MLRKSASSETKVIEFRARRKPQGPHDTDPKGNVVTNRRIVLLEVTREKIGQAFLSGSRMETIRVGYSLPMAAVEEVIREQMRERLRRAA